MSQTLERTVEIVNRLGLHARAAARLVTLAAQYRSDLWVTRGDRTVSGKSIMGVMMLAAAQGSWIQLKAIGDDAGELLDAVALLVAQRFGEDS